MTRRLHIGISGSYGGLNLGDEAILQSILTQLRHSCDPEITVFTRNAEDTSARHGVHAVDVRELSRDEARNEVAALDIFVLGGGGILYDEEAETYLRELKLAQEAGVATMVYAISAGPLNTPAARDLVRTTLAATDVITVRDRHARALLEEVGVEREVIVTADPALLLEPEPVDAKLLEREGIKGERFLVGISVREPGPAAPDLSIDQYHALLADAADYMVERFAADVVFVPMERGTNDLQHSHAVISRMHNAAHAAVLREEYTPSQLVSIVGRFEFALGMRLHFLIFAAHERVPFVALPYASKVQGFIEQMQVASPPLAEVTTGRLLARIDESWDNRAKMREHIGEVFPELQERARETNRLLVELARSRGWKPAEGEETHAAAGA